MVEIGLLVVLLVWLMVCMVFDLRYRVLPQRLTLIPLCIAGAFALITGGWVLTGLAASLILISDVEPREKRLMFAFVVGAFAAIFDPTKLVLLSAMLFTWLLWEAGAMGGADAKLLMVLALVVQQPVIFLFIAMAGGVQGMAGWILRKKEIPYVVAIFAGSALFAVNCLVLRIL